jgi:hypothetical protein
MVNVFGSTIKPFYLVFAFDIDSSLFVFAFFGSFHRSQIYDPTLRFRIRLTRRAVVFVTLSLFSHTTAKATSVFRNVIRPGCEDQRNLMNKTPSTLQHRDETTIAYHLVPGRAFAKVIELVGMEKTGEKKYRDSIVSFLVDDKR